MNDISRHFTQHHKHCDDAYVAAEEAVAGGRWPEAGKAVELFLRAMDAHLGTEERELFPAFEQATGMESGPTTVMRMEHEQLRRLLVDLRGAVEGKDTDGFAGVGQTLLILMQQHNMKEENMLYPMCDRALGDDGSLLDRLLAGLKAG